MNIYGLPEDLLSLIRTRDSNCVYCRKAMVDPGTQNSTQRDWATIEHLNHLPPWNNPETVAFCCGSCNSSRGAKPICFGLIPSTARPRESARKPLRSPYSITSSSTRGTYPLRGRKLKRTLQHNNSFQPTPAASFAEGRARLNSGVIRTAASFTWPLP
jgi:hypothetical protein